MIGLAQTGSGKTGAFALPIIQDLLEHPQPLFACVLSPTRFGTLSFLFLEKSQACCLVGSCLLSVLFIQRIGYPDC